MNVITRRMPKPSYNSKISHPNIYGRIIQHDIWLSQNVTSEGQPTFGNLSITGDTTIGGNLYVMGNSSIFNTDITEFEDNILVVNRLETGSGVILNQAGIEIERGTLENARIVFNEPDDTIRVGLLSDLQAVATREDSPLTAGVMVWNNTSKRLDSTNVVTIPITLSSASTTALQLSGGMVIEKAIRLLGSSSSIFSTVNQNDSTNALDVTVPYDLNFAVSGKTIFPFDKQIVFDTDAQGIVVNSSNKNFVFTTPGSINFTIPVGQVVSIPQQTKLTLASTNDYLGNNAANNTVLASTNDINLTPSANKRILVPDDIPIAFGDSTRKITGNSIGDMTVNAGNNIYLTPGSGLDVRVPVNTRVKFGTNGIQSIIADSVDNLKITASNDLQLVPVRNIVVTQGTLVSFSDTKVNINGSGTTLRLVASKVHASDIVHVNSTENSSTNTSLGSLRVEGGISVEKRLISTEGVQTRSTSGTALLVQSDAFDILTVSSRTNGNVKISAGNGETQASLNITTNSGLYGGKLIEFQSGADASLGYSVGRPDRTLKFKIPGYSTYSSTGAIPEFVIASDTTDLFSVNSDGVTFVLATTNSIYSTDGSLVVKGGMGISKDLITAGRIEQLVDSTSALVLKTNSGTELLKVNSIAGSFTSSVPFTLTDDTESTSNSAGALIVDGGTVVKKKLRVVGETELSSVLRMNAQLIKNVAEPIDPQDAATKNYVDLYIQGISVKESVSVATTVAGTLATGFFSGTLIDSYTLLIGDRILIKNQATASQNGIYVIQGVSTAPTRALDYTTGDSVSGTFVFVKEGTINKNMGFICNSVQGSDVVGTHSLTYTQFTGLGQVDPGAALSSNANQLNVNVDDTSIEVSSDALRIKSGAVGTGLSGGSGTVIQTTTDQSHVTKLGTIDTGIWQGSTVTVPYGGTGFGLFTAGSILYGTFNGPLATSTALHFNSTSSSLGIGTNVPSNTLHITTTTMASLLIHANSGGTVANVYPSLTLKHGSTNEGSLKITRNFDDFATNTYTNSVLLSSSETLQFATRDIVRMTVITTGNIGINTTNPSTTLEVSGTFKTSGLNTFSHSVDATSTSTGALTLSGGFGVAKKVYIGDKLIVESAYASDNSSTGSVTLLGGLSVGGNGNATSNTAGGALTVAGGASIEKNVYIGGSVTSGALKITSVSNATTVADGSISTPGGISASKDIYIGGNITLDNKVLFTGDSSIRSTESTLLLTVNNVQVAQMYSTGNVVVNGTIRVKSTNQASGITGGAFVVDGGSNIRGNAIITGTTAILNSDQSTTTSTGSVVISGGVGIARNTFIGGDASVSGKVIHSENALLTEITNTNVSNSSWNYIGQITRMNAEMENLKLKVNIYDTIVDISHSFVGSWPESHFFIFKDPTNYHLFTKVSPNSKPNIRVHSCDVAPSIVYEGVNQIEPSGTLSNYDSGTWTLAYTTSTNATSQENIGTLICGDIKTRDNLPLIASDYTEATPRNLGVVAQLNTSEITSYSPVYTDAGIPSQTGTTVSQVKLSTGASSVNDFYNGWFIKVTSGLSNGQIRQIRGYNGSQRVIDLETPWMNQGPVATDTVELYNKSTVAVHYTSGSFVTSFNTINSVTSLVEQGVTNLRTGDITCGTLKSTSVRLSSGMLSSDTSASLFTSGGITGEDLYIDNKVKIGNGNAPTSAIPTVSLHVFEENSTIRLQSTSGGYSYVDMFETGNSNRFGILHKDSQMRMTFSGSGDTPESSTSGITMVSSGSIGINTTSVNSPLTVTSSIITTDANNKYLGISGASGLGSGGSMVMYGNNHASSAGNVIITGLKTVINGEVTLTNTATSSNSTTGALVTYGGISIDNTNNATSVTSGGAVTINGGASISRDLYVGGSIVTGSLTVIGLNSSPTITFLNTTNCAIGAHGSVSVSLIGTEALLSFYVDVVPIVSHAKTQFEFTVPSRLTNWPNRGDIIFSVSGWTDDTELYVIQSLLATGIVGTKRAVVKFQSISTATHTLQIMARYTPA